MINSRSSNGRTRAGRAHGATHAQDQHVENDLDPRVGAHGFQSALPSCSVVNVRDLTAATAASVAPFSVVRLLRFTANDARGRLRRDRLSRRRGSSVPRLVEW